MNAKMLYVPQERVHGTIIELSIIFSHCQAVSMATACFRPPKTERGRNFLRFYCLAEYKNERKSAVGNSWRQRTWVNQCRWPVSPTRAQVRKQLNFRALQNSFVNCEANRWTLPSYDAGCTFLFAALIAIWQMYRGKWRLTYWRKVIGRKTTFSEAIFHRILCLFVCSVLTIILFVL